MAEDPRTILFLHGFTHTGRSWNRVRAVLPRGYRAITPDLRGHGDSSDVRPVTLAGVLDDLAPLVPSGPFILGGYSMGGRIALHVALDERFADRIDRLVLIGASPGIADPAEREARREADERLADEVEGMEIETFARRWAQTPVLAGLPAEVAEELHQDRLRSTPAGLAAALRGLGTGALPPLWERLREVRPPVVLVVGERDEKFRQIGRRMKRAISGAALQLVGGAGHPVHLEAPEKCVAATAVPAPDSDAGGASSR